MFKKQGGEDIWLLLLDEADRAQKPSVLRQEMTCRPGAVGRALVPGRVLAEEGAELVLPACNCMTANGEGESEIWYKDEYRAIDYAEAQSILAAHSCSAS